MLSYPTNYLGSTKEYWSATEYDATKCYAVSYSVTHTVYLPQKTSKEDAYYVRCVRDYDKPKTTI